MAAATELATADGRHAERLRWAAELQAQWDAEEQPAEVIDIHTHEAVA